MSDYKALNDFELADLLRSGDKFAFKEIYRRYWDKLYILSRKRLADIYDSEEIVQDIFCNLWRRRETFTLNSGFNNYFSVAVKFEVINLLAKRQKAAAYEREMTRVNTEVDQSTLQTLELNELMQQLQINIGSLPEKCRLVFRLQYEQGYSQRQIAETLNISEKTVEAHLTKARKNLRSAIAPIVLLLICLIFSY
ncbi:MAG: RNA polymerase sigma-70 factor [Bacteroidota bacterium]